VGTSVAWSHTNTFPVAPVSAKRARAFVGALLVEHRLWHLVDPVRVVTSELATHAMMGSASPFTLTLSRRDDDVVLALRREESVLPNQRTSSGTDLLGPRMVIVELLSRDWGVKSYSEGGTELWVSFLAQVRNPS
jgi:hypothetical protein